MLHTDEKVNIHENHSHDVASFLVFRFFLFSFRLLFFTFEN